MHLIVMSQCTKWSWKCNTPLIRHGKQTYKVNKGNKFVIQVQSKVYRNLPQVVFHTLWRLHPWLNLDNCYCLPCYSFLLQSLYISHRPLKSPKYFTIHASLACVDVILKDSDGVSVIAISNRNHLKSMTGCRMIMGNQ